MFDRLGVLNSQYCTLCSKCQLSLNASTPAGGAPGGNAANPPITTDQCDRLMEVFQVSEPRIDRKLAEFRQEVKEGQEGAATKALKRVQLEKPYTCI